MPSFIEKEREIPIVADPEVLVVGAGPAGIGAAVAAARNGAKVLLVERYGYLGGNLTVAMVNPLFTFHDVNGRQVIQGIPGELVDRLVEQQASLGHIRDLTFDNASMTPFDPEGMKRLLFEMVLEAGVELLLHTWVVGAIRTGERVDGVIIENKSGRQAIRPKLIIDCTADADVVAQAGGTFLKGRESDGALQPVTLFFRIANIDFKAVRAWMKQNRQLMKDAPSDAEIDRVPALAFSGLNTLIQQVIGKGEYPEQAASGVLAYQLPMEGQLAVNTTQMQGIDGTNAADLTRAEIETRKQAWGIFRFLKTYVGGFENAYILDTGAQVGVRETRRIVGDYQLTETDVLSNRAFPDGVACGTFAIDIHPPDGKRQVFTGSGKSVYEIPYRSLIPAGIENVLVAGRCISATHAALGSTRVMATSMAIGQGAGTAAAQAVSRGALTRQVDVSALREQLIRQGVFLLDPRANSIVDDELKLENRAGTGVATIHYNPYQK
jgi:hypothetical protein